MDQDVEDEVQNDKEIEKIGQKLGNTAKNTAKNAVNNIKSGIKKAWKAIPLPIRGIVIGAIIVFILLLIPIFILEKYLADNKVAGTSVDKNIGDCVTIVKAPNESDGYYFKIDKDILNNFKDAFNEAYANGEYEASLDSLLYGEDDEEELDDEEIESFLESYNDEDDDYEEDDDEKDEDDKEEKEFDEKEIAQLFGTDDINQARAYFAKMIKAHVASSYPKLGYYEGEEANSEIDKRLDNRFDIDGDYVTQGIIKVQRTKMKSRDTNVQIGEVSGDDIYSLDTVQDKTGTYYIVTPNGVETKRNLPLVVFLHGANGESYNNIKNLTITRYVTTGKAYESEEFIYLAPCIKYGSMGLGDIKRIIDKVVEDYEIDINRINLVGHSSGGYAAWNMVNAYPDYLASDIVFSTITSFNSINNYLETPIWLLCRNKSG